MDRSGLHMFAKKHGTASRTVLPDGIEWVDRSKGLVRETKTGFLGFVVPNHIGCSIDRATMRTMPYTTPRVGDWGDFASGALSGIFAAAHAGIAESQRDDQEKKGAEAVVASIAADTAATMASAQARWSAQMRQPSAAADAAAAATLSAAQDAAGGKLTADQTAARVDAARKALDDATAKALAMKGKPGETFARCVVDAAQATYNKASGQQIKQSSSVAVGPDGASKGVSKLPPEQKSGSFWTDPLVGPVPGWGVVAGGAGVGAILWRVLRGKWSF